MIGLYIFAGIAFLFPVAVYLLFLAIINGRPHPTMLAGPWDFVGVLFATAGFWLVGGPVALYTFHARWRPALLRGDMGELASGEWSFLWVVPWVLYFALFLGGVAFVLWRRRTYTMIYNVAPSVFEEILAGLFTRLGLVTTRMGNRIIIQAPLHSEGGRSAQAADGESSTAVSPNPVPFPLPWAAAAVQRRPDGGPAVLAELVMDPFPAMHHVTLRWRSFHDTIRPDLEAELARQLAELDCVDNPTTGWLLTISSCLFSAIFLGLIGFILLALRGR